MYTSINVLFRSDDSTKDELRVCTELTLNQYDIDVKFSRCLIDPGSFVVGRYSCLPYYDELERDLKLRDATMINTYQQHQYIADMQYVSDITDITPITYNNWGSIPEGRYIIKGRTNSRKHQWNKLMFASSKSELSKIADRLLDDPLIAQQGLIVRQYVPLEQFDIGLNGLPITNEWRFFCLDGQVLCGGYYWASHPDVVSYPTLPPIKAIKIASLCAQRIKNNIRFFVVDVAKTQSGDWIVIELNDGQMSGLSMVEPAVMYNTLFNQLRLSL